MSVRILNALGILSSEVPIGNLLWVDAVNGVDALATRGRMTIPFRTLAAAKNAAKGGDTIVVLPETYNENNVAKNGVNWHFFPGAIVDYNGTGTGLFDTTSGACTFSVTGNGVFKTSNGGATVPVFNLFNTSDNVVLEFESIDSRGYGIRSKGTLRARGTELKSNGNTAVLIEGSSESHLNIGRIHSVTSEAVTVEGSSSACLVRLHANYIVSDGFYGLLLRFGTAFVDAFEIRSATDPAVCYDCGYHHPLHLRVSRIVSTGTSVAALAIGAGSDSSGNTNGAVRLYSCFLWSKNGTNSIVSTLGTNKDVLCMTPCITRPVEDQTKITIKVSTLTLAVAGSGLPTDL